MHTDAQRAYTHPLRDASQTVAALRKSLESFRYHRLVEEIRAIVERELPAGSSLLVISKGDARLLEFTEHRAGHFPQTPEGEYAGYYPASGREAVAELEELRRARGYEYLLIPATAEWWLMHYGELGEYLRERCGEVWRDRHCLIFHLAKGEEQRG